jgi:hypothetical protein
MIFTKPLFLVLTLGLSTLLSFGKQSPIDSNNNSLLWKVQAKGSTKASYLFGTIHQICPEDYFWTPAMQKSLAECESVCFEMNLDDKTVMMKVAGAMIDLSGKTIKDYFSADEFNKLKTYMKDSMGVDEALYERVKLIAIDMLLSSMNNECKETTSYEDKILGAAREQHKVILGLEEAEEQIALLDKIPIDSVKNDILASISGMEKKNEYKNIVALYKAQQLPMLYNMLINNKDLGDSLDPLLNNRNKLWMSKIKEMTREKSVFIAVGCGHLWGDGGVIQLLRNDGYTVSAIK